MVDLIETPTNDVIKMPPFIIKFSAYADFASLSQKRSIIYIRIKIRASALFVFAKFLILPFICACERGITASPPYSL